MSRTGYKQTDRRVAQGAFLLSTCLALAAIACGAGEPGAASTPAGADAADALGAGGASARRLRVDPAGCLDPTGHRPQPIALKGRLVVTFHEPSLVAKACDFDAESSKYWCRSTTMESSECATVTGEIWCPVANPTPDRLGDTQELGSLDLGAPGAGVKRWTHNDVHEAELDISPDGKKVVYAVRKKMDAFEDGLGIWISDSDGNNPRKVVDRAGHTGIPTWLPPGNEKFTFIAEGLHVFDTTTNQTIDVRVDGLDRELIIDPEPSHDGRRITFKADASGGNVPVVYVMDFDGSAGSNVRQLTRGYSDHDPVFSHDNRKIYFERYYGPGEWNQFHLNKLEHPEINQWGIVEVDAEGAQERVLIPHDTCGKHFFWLPTVSPDGKHLMFIHDYVAEDGYQDLWVSTIDGEDAQPVPGTKGVHWFDWSE